MAPTTWIIIVILELIHAHPSALLANAPNAQPANTLEHLVGQDAQAWSHQALIPTIMVWPSQGLGCVALILFQTHYSLRI